MTYHYFRAIIKKSTALEYKLHRLIVNKEDFISYIQVKWIYLHMATLDVNKLKVLDKLKQISDNIEFYLSFTL